MGKKAEKKEDGPEAPDEAAAREFVERYDLLPKMTPFLDRHLVNIMLTEAREAGLYKTEDVTRALLQVVYDAFLPNDEVLEYVEGLYKSIGEDVEEKWHNNESRLEAIGGLEQQVMPLLEIFEDETKVTKIKEFRYRSEMCNEFELEPEAIKQLVPYSKTCFEAGKYDMALKLLGYYVSLPKEDPLYYVIKYAGDGEIQGTALSSLDDAEELFQSRAAGLNFGRGKDKEDKQARGEEDAKCVVLVDVAEGAEHTFVELKFHGKSRERIPDIQAWWEDELARKKAEDSAHDLNIIWGSLASALLLENTDEACTEVAKHITRLDDELELAEDPNCKDANKDRMQQQEVKPVDQSRLMPKREILLHRTWLLHWALFAIFRMERVDIKVVDFFVSQKSLSVISLSCPHLFRYVGAVLILQKRLKHTVKDFVENTPHLQATNYSDPITRFLLALYADMDYDEAQHELQRCELLCKGDYFLKLHWQELQENARLHIFESYCRIHQCINIQMLAEKLNMQAEEAELWIVKLIENAKLDARIDSEKSRVVMTKAPPDVYQQVIEKTKNLAFRSTMLVSNLEKSN